jgi:hypothetical protein
MLLDSTAIIQKFSSLAERSRTEAYQASYQEGRERGILIGKMQSLEEHFNMDISLLSSFDSLSLEELAERHQCLRRACGMKAKR